MIEKEPFMRISLQTLTPLWTGNAYRKITDIKTSSIWGSIRWWYENVSRMYSEKVCNPIAKEKCQLNQKDFFGDLIAGKTADEALDNQKICSVCKLFGCTGWSGKLKLVIEEMGGCDSERIVVRSRTNSNHSRVLTGKMFTGEDRLILHFYERKEISPQEKDMLRLTIRMISNFAAIGGRTAQGNGVVQVMAEDEGNLAFEDPQYLKANLKNFNSTKSFLKFNLVFNESIDTIIKQKGFWGLNNVEKSAWKNNWEQYGFIPIGFHIRDTIRRMERDKNLRHKLFGERGQGSKILVSHGYRVNEHAVQIRVWGYSEDAIKLLPNVETQIRSSLNANLSCGKYNFQLKNFTNTTACDLINQYIADRI
ncbi:hypothetical protein AT864_02567 [Anoxybacillus sp. P3H1B]|uniref:type III-B CRISPR module RAMP protein Cmr1 n=1 Tax=Anoxybacillus sp. P3H1B TaxID=1769293 RepID=UPI0007912545|nr:type III-B CRISPR module RAMP protein Cmr1 [Anoxybacillus sp. P3H1B]KXG09102.1 hypothetical protein AT864_02567 [Anoxybacillus sp. P3H1B]